MAKKEHDESKVRLCLEVPKVIREKILELQDSCGLSTLVDVFKRSLAVFEFLVKHQQSGGKVMLEYEDGSREHLRIL